LQQAKREPIGTPLALPAIGFKPQIQLLESEDSTMPIKKIADAYHDELFDVVRAEKKHTGIS